MRADKRPKLLPPTKRRWPAKTVHGDFGDQLCAKREMFAETTAAKNEIKVISLIDQGTNRICTTQLIDHYTRFSRIYFEQIKPIEPTPLVFGGTFWKNEVFRFVQCFTHRLYGRQRKFTDRIPF